MEFRHLVSFIAIAEELHFGRAAARLHLTQPSLSAQLQKLERTVGVQLVARNSHEVRLTSAGVAFEEHARLILQQLQKAATSAKSTADGISGSLNVGYNLPADHHVLPRAMARMSEAYPDISISLWEKRTGPQLTGLSDGTLDLALMYGRPHTHEFRSRRLIANIPIVAIVGRRHRWAGRPSVRFAELASERCLLFQRAQTPAMYDSIFGAADDAGIEMTIAQNADDPGATAHMVSVKNLVGFASLPRAVVVGRGVSGSDPVAVKLFDPVPVVDLYAVWRADDTSPALVNFLDCLDPDTDSGAHRVRSTVMDGRRAESTSLLTGVALLQSGPDERVHDVPLQGQVQYEHRQTGHPGQRHHRAPVGALGGHETAQSELHDRTRAL